MTDAVIIDMFDETATREDKNSMMSGIMGNAEYDEFEREQILNLLRSLGLNTSNRILDAGAGLGRNIPVLRAVGFDDNQIVAVDFSPQMIGGVRERYPGIETHRLDIADMPVFPDDYFDTTFCMYVLIHVVDDAEVERVINELERVTAGLLIVGQVMDAENKPQHRVCKVREFFEMHGFYKKKKLNHFYKNLYEFPIAHCTARNRVSFAIYE